MMRLLLLPFWPLLPLLSLRPSPRLKLTPTFSMVDMVGMDWDTLAMVDTMDMVLDTLHIMESVRLKLSPRLLLTPTFSMVDMLDTMDMADTMDTPMVDMPTMDKLLPLISKWTANHPCFLLSVTKNDIKH